METPARRLNAQTGREPANIVVRDINPRDHIRAIAAAIKVDFTPAQGARTVKENGGFLTISHIMDTGGKRCWTAPIPVIEAQIAAGQSDRRARFPRKKNMTDISAQPEKSLLIVDDDDALRTRLGRAMENRGYRVALANNLATARQAIVQCAPDFAIIDLRIGDDNGLDVVDEVRSANDNARVVILSGYANIPATVAAVKAGAIDCLPKPADADDLEKALLAPEGNHAEPPIQAISPDEARWAHILHTFEESGRNISQSARRLGMHRRTLQRMLARHDESAVA